MKKITKTGIFISVLILGFTVIYSLSETEQEKYYKKQNEIIVSHSKSIPIMEEKLEKAYLERRCAISWREMYEESETVEVGKCEKDLKGFANSTRLIETVSAEENTEEPKQEARLLTPDELFYTQKANTGCTITTHSDFHKDQFKKKLPATDVSCYNEQRESYALDYKNEVMTYIVYNKQDNFLGKYIELHFEYNGVKMMWILGHLDSYHEDGTIVKTGQKIGKMNLTGALESKIGKDPYHAHIELLIFDGKNYEHIDYNTRSEKLHEHREEQKEYKVYESKQKETTDFTYTPISGDGNLEPDSQKYKDIGEKYGIDWRMISAIHCTETFDINAKSCTRHTSSPVSSAGARGCMQFMPKTWTGWTPSSTGYGVDGDGDGVADIDNCMDSLHSAGNMLSDNYSRNIADGKNKEEARWSTYRQYNHADWYADRGQNIYNTLLKHR